MLKDICNNTVKEGLIVKYLEPLKIVLSSFETSQYFINIPKGNPRKQCNPAYVLV